ncbi:MAG: class I SAM-dependent methyltransferase [Candidatus Diapherotrites archaeon]|nr:class I SAM-dependent methyltransferase [Candidatus Diapherotrites archaeon]
MAEHYFTEEPTSKLRKKTIIIEVNGKMLELETASGVFSFGKPDTGTLTLIRYMELPKHGKILDIGCGYGIIGIVAALETDCDVTMSDVNKRALMLAKKNAKMNGVNVRIVHSNLFENINEMFECILSNPPISAGKDIVFKLIEQSFEHLNKDGTLQIVARSKKGGRSIKQKMEEVFGNVETIGRQSGFHVYKSIKY